MGYQTNDTRSKSAAKRYRPLMHFSPARHWINDPNGLVFYGGRYHVFFQHNPEGDLWGNMSWGHASSSDLVHWKEHPLAISFDTDESILSGSIVHDADNTSGLGVGHGPLVAIYTSDYRPGSPHHGEQAQSLAVSDDGGETWNKYAGSPVLSRGSAHFRDPKVFRLADVDDPYWVMVAVEAEAHQVVLYRSVDLIHWDLLSTFGPAAAQGGVWECPDLFPLIDSHGCRRWILVVNLNPGGPNGGSAGQYFVGDFDGITFTPDETEPQVRWLDWGRDYYASVSFNDVPDGRRLMIAWMSD